MSLMAYVKISNVRLSYAAGFPDTTKPQFSASRVLYGLMAHVKISNVSLSYSADLPLV